MPAAEAGTVFPRLEAGGVQTKWAGCVSGSFPRQPEKGLEARARFCEQRDGWKGSCPRQMVFPQLSGWAVSVWPLS